MPMIDIYATAGTFADIHSLARDAAAVVMRVEQVPDIPMFRSNTAAFVHELADGAISNVDGAGDRVRVQVLTNAGALDRDKQLAVDGAAHRARRGCGGRSEPEGADVGAADRGGARRLGSRRGRPHQRGAGARRASRDRVAAQRR